MFVLLLLTKIVYSVPSKDVSQLFKLSILNVLLVFRKKFVGGHHKFCKI